MEQLDQLEYTMDKQEADIKQQLEAWYKELDKYKEVIAQTILLAEEKQRKADLDILEIKRIRENQDRQIEIIKMKTMSGISPIKAIPSEYQLPSGPSSP